MNKARRATLKKALDLLEDVENIVDSVLFNEQDCLDNMPENLQAGERYENMENAVTSLEEALSEISSAKNSIEDAAE